MREVALLALVVAEGVVLVLELLGLCCRRGFGGQGGVEQLRHLGGAERVGGLGVGVEQGSDGVAQELAVWVVSRVQQRLEQRGGAVDDLKVLLHGGSFEGLRDKGGDLQLCWPLIHVLSPVPEFTNSLSICH